MYPSSDEILKKIGVTVRPDINKINQENAQYSQEATKANSIGGFLGNFGSAVGSNLLDIGKTVLRAAPRATASVLGSFTGTPTLTPETKTEKFVYGSEPIKSTTQRTKESASTLEGYGVSGKLATPIAAAGVLGMTALDLLPPTPGKATAVSLTEEGLSRLASQIAKNTDPADISKALKTAGFSGETVSKLAKPLVDITTPEEVKSFLAPVIKTAKGVERAHITAYKEAPTVLNTVAQKAGEEAGTIIPRSTSALADEARNLISSNVDEAINVARGTNDKAIATGDALVEHFSQLAKEATDDVARKSYEEQAVQIAVDTATKLTEAGRQVQAASILSKTTPAGFVRWAVTQAKNGGFEIPEDVMSNLIKESADLSKMPEGELKNRAIYNLAETIRRLSPSNAWEKVVTVWKAGLLTGPKTTGLNLLSNFFHGVAEGAKEIPANMVDMASSLATGKRTKALTTKGYLSGGTEGIQKGWDYFKTGYDPRNFNEKLDWKGVNFGKGPVSKMFQAYTDTVFRLLGAQDQPFYYGASAHSLYSQAIAMGKNNKLKGEALTKFVKDFVSNPPEEAVKNAMIDASTAVFQQDTLLGGLANTGINYLKANSPAAGALAETIMPFRKTPAGVAMQIFNYTPAGAVAEIASQISKGKFDQKMFSDALGRSITGAGALYIGSELYKNGMITLSFPKEQKEQERWIAEGRKENSVKVDGEWRGLNTLGPIGNTLTIGGFYQKALAEEGSPSAALTKAILSIPKVVIDQTFLKGMSSAVDALREPDRHMETFISGLASSPIPTIVGDIARAGDTVERRKETGTIGGASLDAIKAKIPGARQTLEPRITGIGEQQQRPGNVLETLLDPSRPSRINQKPILEEADRLAEKGFEIIPARLSGKDGYKSLSMEENTKLSTLRGELFRKTVSKLIESDTYKNMSDEKKADTINLFASKSSQFAREKIVTEKLNALPKEELKVALKAMIQEGLVSKEMFKRIAPNLNI